jgi:hypothetical protein
MTSWAHILVAVVSFISATGTLPAEERATITGKVVDTSGKSVAHATVLVYKAGVKKGYSVYCPTCWVDCGKRATSDAAGNFTITRLSPDLWFTLLVVHNGYSAAYVNKVDPAKGPAENAVLKARSAIKDISQVVRGRVVNAHGDPERDAVVEQQGISFRGQNGEITTGFGPRDWIDQMAATNEKGEFEIAYGKPAVRMILLVTPRGMASKLFTEPTGADRKTMTITEGAVIRGRLVQDGKPVANAEVGLTTHQRASGRVYAEMRVGTKEDGTFAITNVPAGRIWLLYPKMESLASRGIGADVIPCETKDDGQEVDLGDIELEPAYTLRGKVILTDGNPVPADMRVTLSADRAWDTQMTVISPDGNFEFHGLPVGVYDLSPGVKGYRLPKGFAVETLVNRNVDNLVIRMEPGQAQF